MDLFRMRCIISAADCLNFSKAAREMFVTQSAITQQIAGTEKELGIKLFRKTGRSMALTEAGSYFVSGLKNIVLSYDALCSQTKRIAAAEDELRIGYHGPMDWGTMLSLISSFKGHFPEAKLSIRTDHWGVLMRDLDRGMLDAVFTEKAELQNHPDVMSVDLFSDYSCVCMNKANPLAKRVRITPDEVNSQTLIMTNSPQPSASMTAIIERLGAVGVQTEEMQFVDQFETALTMVAANMGVAFFPRSFKVYTHPSITFVDLDAPLFHMDIVLAFSKPNRNNLVQEFVDLCKTWPFPELS